MQIMKNYLYTEHDFFNALLFPLKNSNPRIMQVKKNLKKKAIHDQALNMDLH